MKVTINGEEKEFAEEMSVTALLKAEAVKMPDMVSVELNGEIINRDNFEQTLVKDKDTVEFLYFMGGGA